jgi:uncharacterized protein YdeI (YjbR/CyaY-like superfamily)
MPKPLADAPEIEVTSRAALRDWLASNHDRPTGVWIVTYKKADPARHLPTTEIVDEALCWGWIDSLPRAKDAARTMLYLAPRKPGSGWSRVNKAKVARLEAAGRIAPPGRAVIDRARADGSWAALDAVEDLILPEDLDRALASRSRAQAGLGGLAPLAAPGRARATPERQAPRDPRRPDRRHHDRRRHRHPPVSMAENVTAKGLWQVGFTC